MGDAPLHPIHIFIRLRHGCALLTPRSVAAPRGGPGRDVKLPGVGGAIPAAEDTILDGDSRRWLSTARAARHELRLPQGNGRVTVLDYHFYLLGSDGEIWFMADRSCRDDETAFEHAQAFLSKCEAVEVLRGALFLGRVTRTADAPAPPAPNKRRRRRWFAASPPPRWLSGGPPGV